MGIAPLLLKFERIPIKRRTSGQVLDEQDHRFDLVNHGFRLFFLCRTILCQCCCRSRGRDCQDMDQCSDLTICDLFPKLFLLSRQNPVAKMGIVYDS